MPLVTGIPRSSEAANRTGYTRPASVTETDTPLAYLSARAISSFDGSSTALLLSPSTPAPSQADSAPAKQQ